jgi:hypothetical protein
MTTPKPSERVTNTFVRLLVTTRLKRANHLGPGMFSEISVRLWLGLQVQVVGGAQPPPYRPKWRRHELERLIVNDARRSETLRTTSRLQITSSGGEDVL